MKQIVIVWIVRKVRIMDLVVRRVDHWIGAVALVVAVVGLASS